MKATELRIGNLVECNDGTVRQVTLGDFWEEGEGDGTLDLPLIPVPLTEEWLLRFGLTKDEEFWLLSEIGWGIFIERKDNGWSVTVNREYQIAFIQFVHQLQNLFYCLTGEELTIKS